MCYTEATTRWRRKKGSELHSQVQLFVILWTVACPAPLSMEFSRQDYWNGLPFPSLGDLPDLGIKFMSLVSPALAGRWISLSTHKREGSWIRSVAQTADENMTLVLRLPQTEAADVRVMPKNRGCRHMSSWRGALKSSRSSQVPGSIG